MLGERLLPLVEKHVRGKKHIVTLVSREFRSATNTKIYFLALQYDLAPEITRILLEKDNLELIQLLESPESLAAKVEEAVKVFKEAERKLKFQFNGIKVVRKRRPSELNNGSAAPSATSNSVGAASHKLGMLSSMLAAAAPEYRREMLADHLLPLVKQHGVRNTRYISLVSRKFTSY